MAEALAAVAREAAVWAAAGPVAAEQVAEALVAAAPEAAEPVEVATD